MPQTTLSTGLSKALARSSRAVEFARGSGRCVRATDPTAQSDAEPALDGVFDGGSPGAEGPNRLKFYPYCQGPPGSRFYLRLFVINRTVEGDPNRLVWVESPLAEFLCVAGDCPGPAGSMQAVPGVRVVSDNENFCDGLYFRFGSLGFGSYAGSVVSGFSGYPAWAILDLAGCQKFRFDFMAIDRVAMNALWAKA